jgi:hypothetical protein
MISPASILDDALKVSPRVDLGSHLKTIQVLRTKGLSWREIADFLVERGVETDHTKLIRFMQKHTERFVVPDAESYASALSKLRAAGKLANDTPWWAMLKFHFDAHNRTATYTQLAAAAERAGAKMPTSKPWTYANREYGTLAKALGESIGITFQPTTTREKPFYSSAIGGDAPFLPAGAEYELVMHHELAKAMERLLAAESKLKS